MKGIIFNLLEEVVTQAHGEEVWDQLLDAAQVDGAFTSLGNYPDEDLFIREKFEAELATRGMKSIMPAQAYEDRTFEWDYSAGD